MTNVILAKETLESLLNRRSFKLVSRIQEALGKNKADLTDIAPPVRQQARVSPEKSSGKRTRLVLHLPRGVDRHKFSVCQDHYRDALAKGSTPEQAMDFAILPVGEFSKSRGKVGTYCKHHLNKRVLGYKAKKAANVPSIELQLRETNNEVVKLRNMITTLQQQLVSAPVQHQSFQPNSAPKERVQPSIAEAQV